MATSKRFGIAVGGFVVASLVVGILAVYAVLSVKHEGDVRARELRTEANARTETLYEQTISACERGNVLRADIQSIGTATDKRFDLNQAALLATAKDHPEQLETPEAKAFIAANVAANAEYEKALDNIKPIDCAKEYPKP